MAPWDRVSFGHCEQVLGGYPELGNTISSFIFCFIGLWATFYPSCYGDYSSWLVYTLFVWTGIGSALNHAMGYKLWGQLDVIPMFMIMNLAMLYLMFLTFGLLVVRARVRQYVYKVILLLVMGCLLLSLAAQCVDGEVIAGLPLGSTVLMGLPAVACTILLIFNWCMRTCHQECYDQVWCTPAWRKISEGYFWAMVAGGLWLSYEPYCRRKREEGDAPYLLGVLNLHILWHIFIGIGAHRAFQGYFYWTLSLKRKSVHWMSCDSSTVIRFLLRVFPLIRLCESSSPSMV